MLGSHVLDGDEAKEASLRWVLLDGTVLLSISLQVEIWPMGRSNPLRVTSLDDTKGIIARTHLHCRKKFVGIHLEGEDNDDSADDMVCGLSSTSLRDSYLSKSLPRTSLAKSTNEIFALGKHHH